MALTSATSLSSFPQSSTGRLDMKGVLKRSQRRVMISSKPSAELGGSLPANSPRGVPRRHHQIIKQNVSFTIEHFVALQNRRLSDRLTQVTLALPQGQAPIRKSVIISFGRCCRSQPDAHTSDPSDSIAGLMIIRLLRHSGE